ncbi:MAG TPA: ATP-binding protein [Burkholderiales bacterium]|nr:ATP-binding protein [Burkholderiales bacterium]
MTKILTVMLKFEQDVVAARQRARQIAAFLGFEENELTRITTAVSEIARNAFVYAGGGKADFLIDARQQPPALVIRISDSGPGIRNLDYVLSGRYHSPTGMGLGIIGAQRLMDGCDVETDPAKGTTVTLKKQLPAGAPTPDGATLTRLAGEIAKAPQSAMQELQQQNHDMMRALAALNERQDEMLRLNRELEDTNRGVVALYAELDEKADSLRRADETKSRFLSNMSHEFRTPLNSIRALSRMLLERVDGDLNEEQEKQMRFIAKAVEDLTALVDDLLDIAKIEAGKTEVHAVEFSIETMFSALRGMLRPLLVVESVRLVFEDPDGLPMMTTDEGKIAQILRNFISNALKFTERGEIRVRAEFVATENAVRFSVADTGIGIAAADQERVFEEFQQVANSMQTKVKGTGLGLPLCRRLAALLGGFLTLESESGVGSTFSATIPVEYPGAPESPRRGSAKAAQAAAIEADATADAQHQHRATVLIIDDDDSARYVLHKLLASYPVRVLEAIDGISGLQRARALRPDLIFLDVKMPSRDGSEVLADLKGDPATRAIPVVMISTLSPDIIESYDFRRAAAVLHKDDLSPELVHGALARASILYQ